VGLGGRPPPPPPPPPTPQPPIPNPQSPGKFIFSLNLKYDLFLNKINKF